MKVGIIGSGTAGQALANGFLKEGYDVMLGTRNITKKEVLAWKDQNPNGDVGEFSVTAKFGDIIVLATAGLVIEEAIKMAGIENFSGKVVIDATNPLDGQRPGADGILHYFTTPGESLMERIQTLLPQAKLVKAFNSVGNMVMHKPVYEVTPTMFICGNDAAAKETVAGILAQFGYEAEDMGIAAAAGVIEQLCILWCIPGFLSNQWGHAFKLLKPARQDRMIQ